jgi:hypothetical protein
MTTITTVVGPAHVMHRLALGVEALDAIRGRRVNQPLRVGREVAATVGGTLAFPCISLMPTGTGRFKLNRAADVPSKIRLRIDDPTRQVTPRRFDLTLWRPAETDGIDETPPVGSYVPVASRLLRAWLLPGSAAQLPRGTTAIRGRVVRDGNPVRWPRIRAYADANVLVGWAHGDDRGEFVLVITDTATPPPVEGTVDVTLAVVAPPPPAAAPDPDDRLADLVVETVPRSAAPPGPNDLDNGLLRGRVKPPGYNASTSPEPTVTVPVGELLTLPADIVFTD